MSDAFYTYEVFGEGSALGNPAAVLIAKKPWTESAMQALAADVGFSETAFVIASLGGLHLRWFTPTTEIDLCGHATAASAAALVAEGVMKPGGEIELITRSGPLLCGATDQEAWVRLPERSAIEMAVPPWMPSGIRAWTAAGWTVVEVPERGNVSDVDANTISQLGIDGLVVVFCVEAPTSVALRVFGPSLGIEEDPVTGSAHCYLAPLVSHRMDGARYRAEQLSARGGIVMVRRTNHGVEIKGSVSLIEQSSRTQSEESR